MRRVKTGEEKWKRGKKKKEDVKTEKIELLLC